MPYCMYFYRGYTVHAAYDVPQGNVSHGCVRVFPSAAKWLNEEFMTIGTRVTVLSYSDEDGDGDWLQEKIAQDKLRQAQENQNPKKIRTRLLNFF
jgi:L,D-transpeptidase catalytic domain